MTIKYVCTYWGQENTTADVFLQKVLAEGYDGVEINMPESGIFIDAFQEELEHIRRTHKDFIFIAQQVLPLQQEPVEAYIQRMTSRLEALAALQPNFINSHTGKDYFSFDDNCRAIEAAEKVAQRSGIRILHETHRGRFAFHTASLLPYLHRFPQLRLTADFSHWCTVSESLLSDQQGLLNQIIPFVYHLHARVGSAQAPQVNDPFAPEWQEHMETFMGWWKQIIDTRIRANESMFTICPEFGPAPYMPVMPFTQSPLSDQWMNNVKMKNRLQTAWTQYH